MGHTRFLIAAATFLFTSAGMATEEPVDTSRAKDGPLEVHLVLTDEGEELLRAWAKGAPQVTLKSVETAKRGVFLTAIVLFSGCAADARGDCNATVDYVATKPDGSSYGESKDAELWVGRPAPSPGASQLSVEYLGLVIDPPDPSGKYTVSAKVHDHIGKRTLSVSRTFLVP